MMPITAQEDPEDVDDDSPSRVALRVLNVLSTSLPPQHVFPTVIAHVLQYMQSAEPMFRKGAMLSLAVSTILAIAQPQPLRASTPPNLDTLGIHTPPYVLPQTTRVPSAVAMAMACV
ncbi:hypothetical protein H4S03_003444 [Coemansia sp. S3946]|nr:hypothetical protein H4S03_003444 [Coemansia sp. S3946]